MYLRSRSGLESAILNLYFRLRRTVFLIVPLDTLPPKTWGSRWNFVANMSTSRDIRLSRLEAAILDL